MLSDPDFRRLFEHTPQPYLVLSPDFTIVAATEAYLRTTMTERSELVGRPISDVFAENPDLRELRASLDRVLQHGVTDGMPIQKYGHRYGRPVNSPVVGANGRVDFILHHVEDVTDRIAAELHLEEAEREILRAHAQAAAASAAKTEFLSSMSHELRTPLNAVLGFAHLLERDRKQPLTERQYERVGRIRRGGEQLLRLVDDVLDLARIEAGRIGISVEPVAVSEVLAEVKRALEPMETRYGITIRLEPPREELPLVAVDRRRFAQVITNFCSNALKFNRPRGDICVTSRVMPNDRLRVTVVDTGLGIPLSKQSLVFQPFQRAGQETGPIEGTGIGLVITRKLAMLMNSEVGFESEEGEGSSFWIDVPIHRASKVPSEHAARPDSDVFLRRGGPRRRILYIEDNPANLAFMREMIAMLEGVDLTTATSGEAGLEMALGEAFDVIILDIHLAGAMTGLELAEVLRASANTRSVHIIGLSAAASRADRERAASAGFDHYLTKPVVVDELLGLLAETLWPAPSCNSLF